MRSTFKILFYINRQKTKADGRTTILCRITIDGKSSAITTGEDCLPAEWNAKQGQATDKRINKRLAEFKELVEKTYRDLLTRDRVVSVELIKNRLQGIATNPTTLLAMSKAELQSVKECIGKSKAESTYQNLCYSDKLLCEFIKDKGVKDIPVTTITEDLFEEYCFFLKKYGLKESTINKLLCWLSRLMYRAVNQRLIRCNLFENAKYEKTEQKIRFLQKKDVTKVMVLKVNDKEAEQARLMFIFACFTGLAIADMEHLQYGHIQTAADGQKDIRKEESGLKYEIENVDKTSALKVSSENAITNVNKGSYRAELDSFLLEKMKLSANYIFSSYNSTKNEVIFEQQIDSFRVFSNKNARIVFSVESNGDIKNFTLTSVSNIRKDKNETLVPSSQAINRLYHEDLIPKNCRVRATLGYYTYISQTENQVLIPTWNVEISDKDGRVSNYYVDAINLNVLNRKGYSL